jgi:hypothetical protein
VAADSLSNEAWQSNTHEGFHNFASVTFFWFVQMPLDISVGCYFIDLLVHGKAERGRSKERKVMKINILAGKRRLYVIMGSF